LFKKSNAMALVCSKKYKVVIEIIIKRVCASVWA
jgi:hypothetical protein